MAVGVVDLLGLLGLFRRLPLLLLQVGFGAEQPGSSLLQEVVGRGHLDRLRHVVLDPAEIVDLVGCCFADGLRDVLRVSDELGQRAQRIAVLLSCLTGPGEPGLPVGFVEQLGYFVEVLRDIALPAVDGLIEPPRTSSLVDLLVLLLVVETDALDDLVHVPAVAGADEY
ncbi:hypothetical protein GU90_03210 [Saccharopolyspora rectivirgula]|uniref:Uncharacterized protein n=1 Tax=Saccharopolyspora rectivirgula TaxID=28042 RepID=A0A073B1G6_9PSEU|nr:hypothetical protein [Saccharopolyspora rectivirgula]KEI45465.1 hypothetical protein GU90_03210 [Saccharopolyspora rectivirgula]